MFAIAYDGFIQPARYATIEEASIRYEKDVKNRFLYEYDCGIAECDENGQSRLNRGLTERETVV
jgi:hypothetical protein